MEEEVQLGAGMIEFGEPWSVRIPAAINNAEEIVAAENWPLVQARDGVQLTAGEVALAKALWKTYRTLNTESGEEHWPAPLIAFTWKVEKLL